MKNFKPVILTFILLNFFAFILMGIDKHRSKYNKWRIAEKTFFTIAAFGGSPGLMIGMHFFRHKTRHKNFTLGIPLILILQAAAVLILYFIVICRDIFV